MNYAELLAVSDKQQAKIAELNKTNKKLENKIAELELGVRRLLDASTWEAQENAMVEFEELLEE